MPMFATWNYYVHEKSWIGILKARNVVAKFCANFSRKRKFRFSLLNGAYIILTSMPLFATYRVKVEWIISELLTAVLRESGTWKLCTLQVRERFPNLLLVIEICLCIPVQTACCVRGNERDPFNQNFRNFRSNTQWIGSVQPEKFRKNGSTFWGGPLFPVGPVGILVEWTAPNIHVSIGSCVTYGQHLVSAFCGSTHAHFY